MKTVQTYSSGSEDSEEDIVTDHHLNMSAEGKVPSVSLSFPAGAPLVPIISVTPHSPAGKQQYNVLEENLQHLQDIHNSIQQMRNVTAQSISQQIRNLSKEYARICSSCPSLSEQGSDPDLLASLNSQSNYYRDLGSSPNAPDLFLKRQSLAECESRIMESMDLMRRRSWAALDGLNDDTNVLKVERNRSVSLSSMDSDIDYAFTESTTNLLGGDSNIIVYPQRKLSTGSTVSPRRNTRVGGNSSTHSLNEADLQNDFNKILAKREADNRLLLSTIKLPLQKSISTPSILARRDLSGAEVSTVDSTSHVLPAERTIILNRPSGTESETEEEFLQRQYVNHFTDDDHSEKRRKRASLFFRKKKDKSKKLSHQWVSACYGSSQVCDCCSKSVGNKLALYCENCMVTVHQHLCKEHIADCSKIKANKTTKASNKKNSSVVPQSQSSNNQIISEDKELDPHHLHHHEHVNFSDETPLVPFEFSDESPVTANDLDVDPFLDLQNDDQDSWLPTVTKETTKKLKEKEIKRQEHIYEFILTEKHHCLTLRVMQKVFVDGIQKYFQLGPNLDRMFPRLKDLTDIHLRFLHNLKRRQKENPIVESIADILLEQFSGVEAERLKVAYGEFCSRHRDAVNLYKEYFQNDHRFAEFVKHCQQNPLLKKKGIPECILFVTQRLTKYPLLIEPLIKTSKENKVEQEKLNRAQLLIKEILTEVNAQVAEKEKEDRKLEIYNRIEAKNSTEYRGHKFKKSDILNFNRKLKFEGLASVMLGRGKNQEAKVLVIVLSDILFFLQEGTHNKYTFFAPDKKTGVISLQKLLVREKAGADSIYLISSNPAEPVMLEIKIIKPKEKQAWFEGIRSAVDGCPDLEEGSNFFMVDKQKLLEAKQEHIRQIVDASVGFEASLRQKDIEQALILEEKMGLQLRLLAAAGVENIPEPPVYSQLVSEYADRSTTWQQVMTTVKKVNMLASSLYASGSNLSRSVSSVGEHQSETYISPSLPKRAETFSGFDNAQPPIKGVNKKASSHGASNEESSRELLNNCDEDHLDLGALKSAKSRISLQDHLPWKGEMPASLMSLGQEQQVVATEVCHHVYTLSCIIADQITSIDSLQAQLSAYRSQVNIDDMHPKDKKGYRHNQQLEELRNLQDRLQQEKEAWLKEKENEERDLEERKAELLKLQEQVKNEQNDIAQQREQLYRRLEMLTQQNILISPNMPLITSPPPPSSEPLPSPTLPSPPEQIRRKSDSMNRKQTTSSSHLPLNLVSATNQSKKVATNIQIKQQLPLKLASKLASQPNSLTSPTSPGGGVQQMLPLKLSSSSISAADNVKPKAWGYQRLSSPTSALPTDSHNPAGSPEKSTSASHTSNSSIPTHARTGSSPAMMQTVEMVEKGNAHKAGRTNTYPKLPEKFKMSKSSSNNAPSENLAADEEVIFF